MSLLLLLLIHSFNVHFSRTTRISWHQRSRTILVKPISGFTATRDSEWQWIKWAICKSAPHSRQITMPAHWMPFLPPNQQRQTTEGVYKIEKPSVNVISHSLPATISKLGSFPDTRVLSNFNLKQLL